MIAGCNACVGAGVFERDDSGDQRKGRKHASVDLVNSYHCIGVNEDEG